MHIIHVYTQTHMNNWEGMTLFCVWNRTYPTDHPVSSIHET